MNNILETLRTLPLWLLLTIFLIENILIMIGVLVWGNVLQRRPRNVMFSYNCKQLVIALLTCVLNAFVTYAGYWLWEQGYIHISVNFSWRIIADALFLFMSMDFLMYVFHYFIHKTFVYRLLHELHHEATDPQPIDLFILHPLETLSFGSLWLLLLLAFTMNIYGIIIYLIVNVLFGMIGHLGMEPMSEKVRQLPVLRYMGSSTFHHLHHKNEQYNFGFYTSLWDRLFGTFNEST